ncbi:MAG: 6-phosphogluconolactonase [Desulfobulbaceae bacterium]|nr:6-phosphogluconolactonase [Desulfobulbaceae bacterium]
MQAFTAAPELVENLADEIAGCLARAVRAKGRAGLVVSGGSTPEPLFRQLSRKKIDWQHVSITLADERWVDNSQPSSNEHLVRSLLLQNEASAARFIGLKNSAATADSGEQECHEILNAFPRPFDMVILGMGDDGHTASLFPGAAQLARALDMHSGRNCLAITPPDAPFGRMTLTLPALLDSRQIILHITGESKKKTLDKALAGGAPEEMPVRSILRQQKTPVRIFWAP